MRLVLLWLIYASLLSWALGRRGARRSGSHGFMPGADVTGRPGPPGPSGVRPAGAPQSAVARVLIVGATGGTGRELVTQALERGHEVTALARNPAALRIEHPRLRVVRGDVLDYASVQSATEGRDAVISALGHKRFFGPTAILSEGTRNLLRAMDAAGARRLVCETSLGIGDSAGRLGLLYTLVVIPLVLPFYFWDKTRQERLIVESGVEWVIVRPGALTNGPKRGRYRHGRHVGSFFQTVRISRADVADFMLNQVTEHTYVNSAAGVCW